MLLLRDKAALVRLIENRTASRRNCHAVGKDKHNPSQLILLASSSVKNTHELLHIYRLSAI
jgi:hypothetical protein